MARKKLLDKNSIIELIEHRSEYRVDLQKKARALCDDCYGKKIFLRALIEVTNCCVRNCYYCGIRAQNSFAQRYRLTDEEILECCNKSNALGFKTFVLQGGEDAAFSEERVCGLIEKIKIAHSDCAVTLSLGERPYKTFRAWKEAGADRYLLRHETASPKHYECLHPKEQKLSARKECLFNLKSLGFQTGSGFMVGSPFQTVQNLADDIMFLQDMNPQMIGIGPFIPHRDTPFAHYAAGSTELTLFLISLLRTIFPNALIPATTALATLSSTGHEDGILSGANVIMPNVSPLYARQKYELYNNKKHDGDEAAENLALLKNKISGIGYEIVSEVGNYIPPDKYRSVR